MQNSGPSGSLLLSRKELSSSIPCRFIPAHGQVFFHSYCRNFNCPRSGLNALSPKLNPSWLICNVSTRVCLVSFQRHTTTNGKRRFPTPSPRLTTRCPVWKSSGWRCVLNDTAQPGLDRIFVESGDPVDIRMVASHPEIGLSRPRVLTNCRQYDDSNKSAGATHPSSRSQRSRSISKLCGVLGEAGLRGGF
jgi:hypothetical protein